MVVGAAIASSRNNKAQAAAAPQQPVPAQPAAGADDNSIEQLKQLAELKDQGILTQEEFDAKKKQILGL
jgi:hypothetical protein